MPFPNGSRRSITDCAHARNTELTKPANLDKIDSLSSVSSEQRTQLWSSFRWLTLSLLICHRSPVPKRHSPKRWWMC